jgi:hypothetical protein
LCGGLEHLKIETRLTGGRFESVKGEWVIRNHSRSVEKLSLYVWLFICGRIKTR